MKMNNLTVEGLPHDWTFPSTRYRGSKRKLLPWIWKAVKDLPFDSVLDLFGGTGVVSFLFKRMGKQVTYNDYLHFNYLAAVALIKNSSTKLTDADLDFILSKHDDIPSNNFIGKTFRGYYFLTAENKWLDGTIANISALDRLYSGRVLHEKRSLATWSLGQACLIKRPFNLFHRKNLYLRTDDASRGFGNKSTWDTPFSVAMRRFADEANQVVFDNGRRNRAYCHDAMRFRQVGYDLVYLDPPYFFDGQSDVDYRDLYHFLEGIAFHKKWPDLIDLTSYNLRLRRNGIHWPSKSIDGLVELYSSLINRFNNSIIVISHKSNSLVPIRTIRRLLTDNGKSTRTYWKHYSYALSRNNGKPHYNTEWLIIGI